jgi:hypothetical protein
MQRVELRGVKDGVETVLGIINETPSMYAHRLISDWFGPFTEGDNSDADCMLQIVHEVLNYDSKWTLDFETKVAE